MDAVGPLTRGVVDAAVVLQALAGPAPDAPYNAGRECGDLFEPDLPPLDFFRVAVVEDGLARPDAPAAEREVCETVARAADLLASLGCRMVGLAGPEFAEARTAAFTITLADAAAIHAGRLHDHSDRITPSVRQRLEIGRELTGPQVAEAHHRREELRWRFATLARGLDALLLPTTPTTAHRFDPKLAQATARFTAPFNLLGWPAISIPCGLSSKGLPIGVMLAAKPFEEAKLVKLALALEEAMGIARFHPPGYF
jgi:aspartyl-tRNA(Asn)/glutamyl-tRNA(Gln) amidotransferase subunit A